MKRVVLSIVLGCVVLSITAQGPISKKDIKTKIEKAIVALGNKPDLVTMYPARVQELKNMARSLNDGDLIRRLNQAVARAEKLQGIAQKEVTESPTLEQFKSGMRWAYQAGKKKLQQGLELAVQHRGKVFASVATIATLITMYKLQQKYAQMMVDVEGRATAKSADVGRYAYLDEDVIRTLLEISSTDEKALRNLFPERMENAMNVLIGQYQAVSSSMRIQEEPRKRSQPTQASSAFPTSTPQPARPFLSNEEYFAKQEQVLAEGRALIAARQASSTGSIEESQAQAPSGSVVVEPAESTVMPTAQVIVEPQAPAWAADAQAAIEQAEAVLVREVGSSVAEAGEVGVDSSDLQRVADDLEQSILARRQLKTKETGYITKDTLKQKQKMLSDMREIIDEITRLVDRNARLQQDRARLMEQLSRYANRLKRATNEQDAQRCIDNIDMTIRLIDIHVRDNQAAIANKIDAEIRALMAEFRRYESILNQ